MEPSEDNTSAVAAACAACAQGVLAGTELSAALVGVIVGLLFRFGPLVTAAILREIQARVLPPALSPPPPQDATDERNDTRA